jgi:hypothetical protein
MVCFKRQYAQQLPTLLCKMATRFAKAHGLESRNAFADSRPEQSMVHKALRFTSPVDTDTVKRGDMVEIVGEWLDVNIGEYDHNGVARTVKYTQEHDVIFVVNI